MRGLVVLSMVLVALAGTARADDRADAKTHFDRGTMFYDLQRYAEAAAEYEQAYEIHQDPALLYNIGQARRFAHEYDKALAAYRAYLRHVPGAPNRADVESRISELTALVERLGPSRPQDKSVEPPPEPAPPASVPAPAPAGAPVTPAPPPTPSPSPRARTLTIAGFSTAGAGAALIILGGVFTALGNSAAAEVNDPKPAYVFSPSTETRVHVDNALAISGFVVGGAALVAGVTVGVIGLRAGRAAKHARASRWALAPGGVAW